MIINEILERFNGIKKVGTNQFTALCPCHNDTRNSLSIGVSDDGNCTLIHCFAGCDTVEILREVGLEMKDLYVNIKTDDVQILRETEYLYHTENGELSYKKIRKDYSDGKKTFSFQTPDGKYGLNGKPHELYNLPAILSSDMIFFVEGEKCADIINQSGYTATTLDSGANSRWNSRYTNYLQNKNIIIVPDNDIPGFKYAKKILDNLPSTRVKILPDISEKEDIFDWIEAGHTMEEVLNLPDFDLISFMSNYSEQSEKGYKTMDGNLKETQAEKLVRLVEETTDIELFHDHLNRFYAVIPMNGHKEIWDMDTDVFKLFLQKIYRDNEHKIINKENLTQAINILSSKALFDNKKEISLNTRIARDETEHAIWYDLTNSDWQTVKITENGWTIENNPPILFKRFNHQKPQLLPCESGDIRRILKYVNVQDYQTLFLTWIVCSFIPEIQHPMIILHGEKGAAKTTASKFLKNLIDPSGLDTLMLSKKVDDLIINLEKHWFLPFDNISSISTEISDILCQAITGSGIQKRKLYTDAEDYICIFQRCMLMNGINNMATRPDLLDRSILIELTRISESDRKEFAVMMKDFMDDLPSILGGVFNLLSSAIKLYPSVHLDSLPRMADFARWGFAVAEAMGGFGQKFLNEYKENQGIQNKEALNTDLVAVLLVSFMENQYEWEGKVSELYLSLKNFALQTGINTNCKDFPKQPNILSRKLNELRSNLQFAGITFESEQRSKGTFICIKNTNESPLPPFVPLNHSTVSDKNILSESNDSSEENGDDPVVIF